MANSKVALLMRVRLRDGKRIYAAPVVTKNGKFKPLNAVIDGKVEHHPEGVYVLRYREDGRLIYRQVGSDADAAETAKLNLQLELRRKAPGAKAVTLPVTAAVLRAAGSPTPVALPVPADDKRKSRVQESLTSLRDSFIKKFAYGSADTIYAYTYVATEFVTLVTKRDKNTPVDLDESDVLAFDRHLESKGNSKTTRASRYGYVRCFLRHCGLNPSRTDDKDETSGVVSAPQHKKLKAKPKLAVETFNEADLQKLYAVSSERHRMVWMAFRMLGLRDEELAYTLWSNIDWEHRLWLVRFKPAGSFPWNPKLGWKSKDSEERDIPIPDVLYTELKTWRNKNPKSHLVFPTSGGQTDIKLLKALKSDWRNAGLNCGHCVGCLGPKIECGKAKLKTFRSTYLTTMLRYVDLRSVQALAGHSDIATTQRYLAPASQAVLQNAANAAFGSAT
ncbi:site-specific integrase [Alloacidobacterium dinghuense]|uniref:Site-specific integrase n=1 Tax=Alloacidobacterium dinghuense TaxID=2763107 RepID=A0A7G8BHI9_9BACT|nr:site-specific integrase [Alloacidobacterium dinghuense]QNI32009.1 site-specific integrase [Alloacidobacterium dinghuense]